MKYPYFGRYLYSLRIRRGFENVSDFIENLNLPMSDNYYRDVEAGRKLPTIDKARELFEAMPFDEGEDKYEFFWHYLRELLPDEIHKNVMMPRVDTSFKNMKSAQELLEYDLKMHRTAAALARFEETQISTDNEIDAMTEQFELLPLVHYIHMVESATSDDINAICKNNGITFNEESIDSFFTKIGVSVEQDGSKKRYTRRKPIIRIPKNNKGLKFKDKFLYGEIEKSLANKRVPEIFSSEATFLYSMITAIPEIAQAKLTDRLRDLISEVSVSKTQLDDKTATPFFFSIVISGRPEYKIK